LVLAINNAFFLDSFNDYIGQFQNHLLLISQPFIEAILSARVILEPPISQEVASFLQSIVSCQGGATWLFGIASEQGWIIYY